MYICLIEVYYERRVYFKSLNILTSSSWEFGRELARNKW